MAVIFGVENSVKLAMQPPPLLVVIGNPIEENRKLDVPLLEVDEVVDPPVLVMSQ
jgi:hypothetical protein